MTISKNIFPADPGYYLDPLFKKKIAPALAMLPAAIVFGDQTGKLMP